LVSFGLVRVDKRRARHNSQHPLARSAKEAVDLDLDLDLDPPLVFRFRTAITDLGVMFLGLHGAPLL
jgi:hypothetical protein